MHNGDPVRRHSTRRLLAAFATVTVLATGLATASAHAEPTNEGVARTATASANTKPDFRLYGKTLKKGGYSSLCVAVKDRTGGSRQPLYFDLFHPSDTGNFGHYELGVRVTRADPDTWGKGWRRWWLSAGGEYGIRPTARRMKVSESYGESSTTIPRIGARAFNRICTLPT